MARRQRLLLLLLWIGSMASALRCEAAGRLGFDVPAGQAERTLRIFAQQSGEQIIYPVEEVRGLQTNAVRANLTPLEALRRMLANTGLVPVEDDRSGALTVQRAATAAQRAAAAQSVARTSASPSSSARTREGDVIVLSPFEVRSRTDRGYRAVNSVSGSLMAVPIRELPMTVTAFPQEFIADQRPYDLYDVVKWAPGVHQDNNSPQGWVRYSVRGFTGAAVQRNGFEAFRFIDTTNVARVEVVKGPASLLYGQINPGGVINYITKRPEPVRAVEVTTGFGDRGYRRAVIDATGPVPGLEGHLLYRGIAMTEEMHRFQTLVRGHKSLLAPSLTWILCPSASLTVDYEHFVRSEDMPTSGVVMVYTDGIGSVPYPTQPWNFNYAGKGDFIEYTSDAFTAEFTGRLGEHLTVRGLYVDAYWDHQWRASGQAATGLLGQSFIDAYYPPSAGLTPRDAMYRRNRYEHQWGGSRAAQWDLTGSFEIGPVKLRPLVGYKAKLDQRYDGKQWNNPNVAGDPLYLRPWDLRNPATWDNSVPFDRSALVLAGDNSSRSNGYALYSVLSATAWGDRLHLFGGYARYRDHTDPLRNLFAPTPSSAAERTASVPQAGALVQILPRLAGFVSYSESFIANTSLLRVNSVPATPAKPSLGRGWEAGFKTDSPDGRFGGAVSVYRIKASPTGIITVTTGLDASGSTLFTDVQGGSQLSEGVELDLFYAPIRGLQLIAGFSRCDAIYVQHPTNPALNRTPLVATPDRTASLWGKYLFENGRLAGFTLAGGISYVGSMTYIGNNPSVRLPTYTTLDLTVGYRFDAFGRRWAAELAVKNLTDERYYASRTSWGFPRHTIFSLSTRF